MVEASSFGTPHQEYTERHMPKLSQYERFDPVGAKIRRFHKHLLETICARTGKSQRELIESWIEREFEHEPALQRYKHVIDNFRAHIQALEDGTCEDHTG